MIPNFSRWCGPALLMFLVTAPDSHAQGRSLNGRWKDRHGAEIEIQQRNDLLQYRMLSPSGYDRWETGTGFLRGNKVGITLLQGGRIVGRSEGRVRDDSIVWEGNSVWTRIEPSGSSTPAPSPSPSSGTSRNSSSRDKLPENIMTGKWTDEDGDIVQLKQSGRTLSASMESSTGQKRWLSARGVLQEDGIQMTFYDAYGTSLGTIQGNADLETIRWNWQGHNYLWQRGVLERPKREPPRVVADTVLPNEDLPQTPLNIDLTGRWRDTYGDNLTVQHMEGGRVTAQMLTDTGEQEWDEARGTFLEGTVRLEFFLNGGSIGNFLGIIKGDTINFTNSSGDVYSWTRADGAAAEMASPDPDAPAPIFRPDR